LLAERYPTSTIWGLDFSHEVISFLAPRFPKVHYIEGDALRLPFEDESMDYVVAAEIMEHMDDPQALIDECMRVVKPGGWLAVSTPHIEAEKKHKIGGHLHVWSFDEADLHTLFPSPAVEVLTEGNNLTWLIWQQK
jgi:ubiquinone/menaquinone biosynthesis C-methylase UbiE